jgi:small subunit ribosomal protein S13
MNKLSTNKKSFLKNLIENNYGIGIKTGTTFFKKLGLNNRINPKTFKRKQINEINKNSLNTFSGKKLKENKKNIILFLSKNKTYKGIRHKLKYPARGQRTHTNAKTKKKFKY